MVKVVIVGGGALGAATALALAEAGANVTVIDAPAAAPNASAVAAGMLAPAMEAALDPLAAAHVELLKRARAAWPDFARRAGIRLDERGAWAVGSTAFVERVRERLLEFGFATDGDLDAARTQAPGLGGDVAAAVFAREDAGLQAEAALGALRDAAERLGAQWVRASVLGHHGGRGETDAGDFTCDHLILATGAAVGLAPKTALLEPIKGHILHAEGFAYAGPMLRGEGVYLAPAARGVRIGASMEPGVRDLAVSPDKVAALRAAAVRLVPELAEVAMTARTGIRAATPDGLPWVGPSRDGATLLALGARRNGWLLAPLVAQALTAYVMGRAAPAWAEALAPNRGEGT